MDVEQVRRTERTVSVGDRQIFVTEAGAGDVGQRPPVRTAPAVGFMNSLLGEQPLDDDSRRDIDRRNADALFPRLGERAA
jgi:hypothetical protein